MVHFRGTEYRAHTSCISEAQKYQGQLYKEKDKKGKVETRQSVNGHDRSQAMVPRPRSAYVEDAPEGDETYAVTVVDVPPRAPTPPAAPEALPENINVFDFLVTEEAPNGGRREVRAPTEHVQMDQAAYYPNGDSRYSQYSNGDGSQFTHAGYSYGSAPIQPSVGRYDSWQNLTDSQQSNALMPPPPYVTPGPRHDRVDRKEKLKSSEKGSSDKKRKRQNVEELDLSSTKRPSSRDATMTDAPAQGSRDRVLHSGLTGGLSKLVTDPEAFRKDRIDAGPTPISPIKRSKREKDLKDERRKSSYTSYSTKATSSRNPDDRHPSHDRHHHRSHSPDRSEGRSDRHTHKQRKRRSSSSSDERHRTTRKVYKAIEYPDRPSSVQPDASNQIVSYRSRAELFMSFVTKGPDSERGLSINKALKRYHHEREVRSTAEKEEEDKDLWRSLRLRRNDRGEIVLFL